MEYYGNNDWRDYIRHQNELRHFGIPKRSGRYPWGSGEDPYHHGADAPGGKRKRKSMHEGAVEVLKKKIDNGSATKFEKWQYKRAQEGHSNIILDTLTRYQPKSVSQATKDAIEELKLNETKDRSNLNSETRKLSGADFDGDTVKKNIDTNSEEVRRQPLNDFQKDLLNKAKKEGVYDTDFIYAIKDKVLVRKDHADERLKAYEEYLRDPDDFTENKLKNYKKLLVYRRMDIG